MGPRGGRGPRRRGPEMAPKEKLESWRVERKSRQPFPGSGFYDPSTLRTLFIDFPKKDWFEELGDFYRTDVEVPGALTMDGQTLKDVGIRFRGNSSYFGIGDSKKKSIGISIDHVHKDQRLHGYRTLNLLNANDDPSFMREIIYTSIHRDYAPAAKSNWVHVVINGESWGVYMNVQQLNKDFMKEWFGSGKGARWKVPPSFSGKGALKYLGEETKDYKGPYQLKTNSAGEKEWQQLKAMTHALNETPIEKLPDVLPDVLDVNGALWFLALDNVFMDGDGYFSRGSDFALWLDRKGIFHVITRDNNETFNSHRGGPGGPGGRRGGRGRGPGGNRPRGGFPEGPPPRGDRPRPPQDGDEQDGGRRQPRRRRGRGGRGGQMGPTLPPLEHMNESERPLIERLLQVPRWKARYLAFVRHLATERLEPGRLATTIAAHDKVIEGLVKLDDKSLYGHAAYVKATGKSEDPNSIQSFAEARRKYLLAHESLKATPPAITSTKPRIRKTGAGRMHIQFTVQLKGKSAQDARVFVHAADGSKGRFNELELHDDGKHNDNQAGDGIFGGTAGPFDKKTCRYYVEAFSPQHQASSFHPASTEKGALKVPLKK